MRERRRPGAPPEALLALLGLLLFSPPTALLGCAGSGGDAGTPAAAREADVKDQIEQAFRRDPVVNRLEVDVRVDEGIVTLYGDVGTPEERMRAESLARDVAGVRAVDNQLQVSEGGLQQRVPAGTLQGGYPH